MSDLEPKLTWADVTFLMDNLKDTVQKEMLSLESRVKLLEEENQKLSERVQELETTKKGSYSRQSSFDPYEDKAPQKNEAAPDEAAAERAPPGLANLSVREDSANIRERRADPLHDSVTSPKFTRTLSPSERHDEHRSGHDADEGVVQPRVEFPDRYVPLRQGTVLDISSGSHALRGSGYNPRPNSGPPKIDHTARVREQIRGGVPLFGSGQRYN